MFPGTSQIQEAVLSPGDYLYLTGLELAFQMCFQDWQNPASADVNRIIIVIISSHLLRCDIIYYLTVYSMLCK